MSEGDPMCGEMTNLERPNFVAGMLLAETDLRADQEYHRRSLASHVRRLHGYGTVCGLAVRPGRRGGRRIVVEPGVAIDCCGREIVVPSAQVVDLDEVPMWATVIEPAHRPVDDFVVTVRYTETGGEPAPVLRTEAGTEPAVMARSTREGFELELHRDLDIEHHRSRLDPDAVHRAAADGGDALRRLLVDVVTQPCPGCDDERVPLARLTPRRSGAITEEAIDNTVRPIVLGADLIGALVVAGSLSSVSPPS